MSGSTSSSAADSEFNLQRILRDTFVEGIEYFPSIDSTNNAALDSCRRTDLQYPHLVLAAQQTAGRGRGSNRWWSAAGALTFSLLINTGESRLPRNLWPKTSLVTGLSVCATLAELLPDREIRLKWPNDVHLSGRKVCGVLIESGPQTPDRLILGIGLNVNNSFDAAPETIRFSGTSIYDETGRPADRTDLLIRLLRQLDTHLARLSTGDTRLVADWKSRCALSGRTVEVAVGTRKTTGVCREIDEDGALVLITEGGLVRLHGGTVIQIW